MQNYEIIRLALWSIQAYGCHSLGSDSECRLGADSVASSIHASDRLILPTHKTANLLMPFFLLMNVHFS